MKFFLKFTQRDLFFATLTGLITSIIMWQVLGYLRPGLFHNPVLAIVFILGIPILWILGVLLGYFLGQWLEFFNQFGKFAAIGFTNFAVNDAVLNILIARTGYVAGVGYSLIAGISFIVALLSSYIWNKYWAFHATRNHNGGAVEFGKFLVVTIIGFLVNVGVASVVVNLIHPFGGFNPQQWANVGVVAGAAIGLIFTFVGYRLTVFNI